MHLNLVCKSERKVGASTASALGLRAYQLYLRFCAEDHKLSGSLRARRSTPLKKSDRSPESRSAVARRRVSRLEKVGVRAGDQFLETVGGPGLGKTERDRVVRVCRRQCCGDLLEACPSLGDPEVRDCAEQLAAAVAPELIV